MFANAYIFHLKTGGFAHLLKTPVANQMLRFFEKKLFWITLYTSVRHVQPGAHETDSRSIINGKNIYYTIECLLNQSYNKYR
jgi:hypothetical protein